MKSIFSALVLVLGFSIHADAKASKVCFGMGDAKGSHFTAEISRHQVVLSATAGDAAEAYEGRHKYVGDVQGRDGITYNEFETGVNDEGGVAMLVDENLNESGTKGLIKMRWRGEGFADTKFLCRDQE